MTYREELEFKQKEIIKRIEALELTDEILRNSAANNSCRKAIHKTKEYLEGYKDSLEDFKYWLEERLDGNN